MHNPKSPAERRNAEMRRIFYLIQRDGGETGIEQGQLAKALKVSPARVRSLLREMKVGNNKKHFPMKKQTINGKKFYYVDQPQVSLLQEA